MEDIKERLAVSFLAFGNRPVKVMALKELRGLRLEGLTVGPYEERREYEEKLWVAEHLAAEGYVNIKPGQFLDSGSLSKIHWTEMIQSAKQLSSLPEGFYPKLKRYLADVKAKAQEDPRELPRYEKSKQLAADIVERRLRRIAAMASGPSVANNVLRPFSEEELILYQSLRSTIGEWRHAVLELDERGGAP